MVSVAALAAMLAGCGGGGGAGAGAAPAVLQVNAAVQPDTATPPSARVLQRAAALAEEPARVTLGAFAAEQSAMSGRGGARQIGAPRAIEATASAEGLRQRLRWSPSAGGARVAAVSFSSEGAYGVRLGLLVRQMPPDAVVRIYRQDHPTVAYEIAGREILAVVARNLAAGDTSDAARTWWSPDPGAGEATLEIELPAGVPASALDVAVPMLSHVFEDLSLPREGSVSQEAINDATACNLDATCYDEYADQRNAVARMTFVEGGRLRLCTGTLLNDRDATRTPYFITANHCISTQTVASTLQTDWFFRSPTCNSRMLSASAAVRTGGATLLYASGDTDTAFLRLNEAPPPGAVFAAWDAGPQSLSAAVTGIHHPRGDLQKISFGSIMGTLSCQGDVDSMICDSATGDAAAFYDVGFTQGTVQTGSSGSAIFRGGRLIGTLYGFSGNGACTVDDVRVYGRFDRAYGAALRQWLSPA
ncbi:serine protease [Acidovorax sp. NCPPB 2350]|nr:serine protease [Acidovorax sp. NCPPB 2350]